MLLFTLMRLPGVIYHFCLCSGFILSMFLHFFHFFFRLSFGLSSRGTSMQNSFGLSKHAYNSNWYTYKYILNVVNVIDIIIASVYEVRCSTSISLFLEMFCFRFGCVVFCDVWRDFSDRVSFFMCLCVCVCLFVFILFLFLFVSISFRINISRFRLQFT